MNLKKARKQRNPAPNLRWVPQTNLNPLHSKTLHRKSSLPRRQEERLLSTLLRPDPMRNLQANPNLPPRKMGGKKALQKQDRFLRVSGNGTSKPSPPIPLRKHLQGMPTMRKCKPTHQRSRPCPRRNRWKKWTCSASFRPPKEVSRMQTQMKIKLGWAVLLTFSMAHAQQIPNRMVSEGIILNHEETANRMLQAKKQIVLFTPAFTARGSSEALRLAANRGVNVVIITTLENLTAANSVVAMRMFAPNTKVFTVKLTSKSNPAFVVLDGQEVLVGSAVSTEGTLLNPSRASVTHDRARLNSYLGWVNKVVKNSKPVDPEAYLKRYGLK